MQDKDESFPANNTKDNKAMVPKHEFKFVNTFGTLHCKLSSNATNAYFPVLQQVGTIMRCYQELGHNIASNFDEFLKAQCWWATMRTDAGKVLRHFEIDEKFVTEPEPPKLFITITVKEIFTPGTLIK